MDAKPPVLLSADGKRLWSIGEEHPEYGVVQMMGVTGGEAYRWFVKDNIVSMIPLNSLEGR